MPDLLYIEIKYLLQEGLNLDTIFKTYKKCFINLLEFVKNCRHDGGVWSSKGEIIYGDVWELENVWLGLSIKDISETGFNIIIIKISYPIKISDVLKTIIFETKEKIYDTCEKLGHKIIKNKR